MKHAVAALALSLASFTAHAQPFVELGFGQSDVDVDFISLGATSQDTKDTTFNISGGWMFTPMIGIEIGYRDLGEVSGSMTAPGVTSTVTFEAEGFQLGAVGRIPLGTSAFSIVPRVGLFKWDVKGRGVVNGVQVSSLDEDGTDLYFGVGADYSISKNLHVGAHWARFDLDDLDVDVIELRVGWRF
jgi:OmpA-OmpF porin, OOP family